MVIVGLSFLIGPILCKKGGPFCVSKLHIKGLKIYSHSFATKSYFFCFYWLESVIFLCKFAAQNCPKINQYFATFVLDFCTVFSVILCVFFVFLGRFLGFLGALLVGFCC